MSNSLTSPRTSSGAAQEDLASVGRRVAAQLVDEAIAVLVLCLGYGLLIAAVVNGSGVLLTAGLVLAPLLGLGYTVWFVIHQGRTGGSPGKHALGIGTVDQDTLRPIGVGRVLVRQLVLGVLGPLNLIQLPLIGRHPRRQGWHDRVARSTVVAASAIPAAGPAVPEATKPTAEARGPRPPAPLAAPTAGLSPEPAVVAAPPKSHPAKGSPAPARASAAPPMIEPSAPPVAAAPPVGMVAPPPGVVSAPPAPVTVSPAVAESPRQDWLLTPDSGPPHVLTAMVLVGRDPDPELVEGAGVWAVDDPALSVSKTHALLGCDGGSCWVEDWHSTNGVELHRLGEQRPLGPHERTELADGDVLLLGDFRIAVSGGRA